MQKLFRFLYVLAAPERILVVLFFSVFVGISLFQTIGFAFSSPPGAVYPFVHGYPPDFYWYLSLLKQGSEGKFFIESHYTPENFTPQAVNTFFVVWGFFFQWVPTHIAFLVGRIFWGVAQYVAGYGLAAALLPTRKSKRIAAMLFLFGVPFWWIDQSGWVHIFGEVWSELDPTVRNAFLPHHMAATGFFVAVMCFFAKAVTKQKKSYALIAGICAALAALSNPGSAMVLLLSMGIVVCLHIFTIKRWFVHMVITIMPLACSLWYLNTLQHTVFPWTEFVRWERFVYYPVSGITFLLSLGIPGIISVLVLPSIIAKRNILWSFLVGWFVAPFIGLEILVRFLPVSNMRYLQSAVHIPAAILASYGLWLNDKKLSSRPMYQRLYRGCVCISFCVVAVGSFWASWSQQMRSVEQGKYNLLIQVPTVVFEGIQFLANTGTEREVVIAPSWISTMIPALTNKRVIAGHPTFTYEPEQKVSELMTVYAFSEPDKVREIFHRYKVRYLWIESIQVPQEAFISALGLEKIYTNAGATVYAYKEL